ncbi:hypothetical protein G5T42_02295 [Microbacterium sp. 4R-513]|uniref:cell division protein PerM n=1 Tax=Microbacterium sp. 4R-513 TaxID=2567934 RepID=UPI0013E1654E|nr:DUF6350 family protein [Microbacterium sp. 4R-513]QIG38453.1 hypothetical protein G5T42_02295 [Microbacterium sp. 4R-513]
MHRLIVAFLAAFDAAIAVAVGVAAILAPLTLVWVLGLGDTADWGSLWPASAAVWQLGHLVPLAVALPGDYLAATGIDESAASFVLSLAPLAFATFTGVFAARSGSRASRADAWATGVATGTVVVAVLATLVALTSQNPVAKSEVWQGIAFPTLIYAVPALVGAVVTEWREAPSGLVASLRDRAESWRGGWGDVIGVSARASSVAVVGLVGAGALLVAVSITLRAGDIVALYQAGNVDLLGATVVTLGQLAYLPTLVVWGIAFVAGPGFSLGAGTAVSPSGTQVGVVPGVPLLGAVPESSSPWLLLLALVPVAIGALAGWVARSRLLAAAGYVPRPRPPRNKKATDAAPPAAEERIVVRPTDDPRRSTLEALLAAGRVDAAPEAESPVPAAVPAEQPPHEPSVHIHEPFLPRLVVTVAIALVAAGAAALLALFASGSAGPGRLSDVGPDPGPVALAVGLEIVVGAGILLLASRRGSHDDDLVALADAAEAATPPVVPGSEAVVPGTTAVASGTVPWPRTPQAVSPPRLRSAPPPRRRLRSPSPDPRHPRPRRSPSRPPRRRRRPDPRRQPIPTPSRRPSSSRRHPTRRPSGRR